MDPIKLSFSASQAITFILWNPEVYSRAYQWSPSLVRWSQFILLYP